MLKLIKKIKEQISKNIFQNEYLIFEILFSLNKDEKLDEKYKKIKNEIATGNFGNAALIYSISDSSTMMENWGG